jgi:hypothetical protein
VHGGNDSKDQMLHLVDQENVDEQMVHETVLQASEYHDNIQEEHWEKN